MKAYKVFFLIIFITTLSCNRESSLEINLIDVNKKWTYSNSEKLEPNTKFSFFTKFSDSGECANVFLESGHTQNKGEWKYSEKDSVLEMFTYKFKVLEIQKDTIMLMSIDEKFQAQLINISGKG